MGSHEWFRDRKSKSPDLNARFNLAPHQRDIYLIDDRFVSARLVLYRLVQH